jgi:hypothetical protein
MEVYIVYRIARDRGENVETWSIYDNEIAALRECNYYNSENGLYFYFTLSKQVLKVFEV